MKIFVSYATEHRDIAEELRLGLLNAGHEVFFDRDSLPPGGDFHTRIAAAIAGSDLMIFLLGPRSIAHGTYARTELKLAQARWPSPVHHVLPVMIEPVGLDEIPAYLKSVTLLEPEGNPVAETLAAVSTMAQRHDAADLAERTAPITAEQLLSQTRRGYERLTTRKGLLLSLAAVVLIAALFNTGRLATIARDGVALVRVAQAGATIPLKASIREPLTAAVGRLAEVVHRDALSSQSRDITPWALSQATLGLLPEERLPAQTYLKYVREAADPACACWTEMLDKPGDKCVFISGWMLVTMAKQGIAATRAEIDYLLREQQSEGAWAMFPVPKRPEFASTYATAWILMGLHAQRSLPGFPRELQGAVDKSIANGKAWLLSKREHDAARWKRYPNLLQSDVSISISGLALHALHAIGTDDRHAIDALWIASLPSNIAGEAENPYVLVGTDTGTATDFWEQIKLPWVLAATVDSYATGGLLHRGRTLRWMEQVLADPRVLSVDTESRAWWRAEFLYGLRHALDHTTGSAASPPTPSAAK